MDSEEKRSAFERFCEWVKGWIDLYNARQRKLALAEIDKRLERAVAKEEALEKLVEEQKKFVAELLDKRFADEKVLTFEEAREWLSLSDTSLRKYMREGVIPYKKVGKHVRFPKKALEEWMEEELFGKGPKIDVL